MVTSATQKPNPSAYGEYERGVDPWHRDAFPAEFKDQAPRQENPRAEGWYELDWCGNVINFIPDGTPLRTVQIESATAGVHCIASCSGFVQTWKADARGEAQIRVSVERVISAPVTVTVR